MILREMPPIWNPAFRPGFYARWGRENCIISALTQQCEYEPFRQTLSIKAAWGGHEDYFVDGRRIAIDDDTFIIMNHGRTYASRVRARTPLRSFSIFFRPGMAEEVWCSLDRSQEQLLDDPGKGSRVSVEFSEHSRRHHPRITPVLRHIRRQVDAGLDDEQWYEEQLYFLLQRMFEVHAGDARDAQRIPAARPSTRLELFRRIGRGVDFINTHFDERIGLEDIAAAASLSPYHFLRVFSAVEGMTPGAYLRRKRRESAERTKSEHASAACCTVSPARDLSP
jgi:AraC family transcriptional regulator